MQATGVLYQSVWNAISDIAWSSNVTKQKAIAFVEFLFRKRHMENTDPMEYTDLARNYFAKKLGERYRDVTRPLLAAGILQSSNYYRPGYYTEDDEYIKGQCLSYRINPDLLDDDIIKINYKGEKTKQRCRDEVTMTSKRIMRQVRIPDLNSRELIQFVKKSLSDARIRALLKVNDEILDSQVHIKGRNHPIAIEKVQRRTKDLIKDGKYCHIEHLDVYIKRKRRQLTQAYCDQLLRIKHRNIYADRNETNLRLDSNLTNLKSDFMSLLTIDGQRLSQVDLKNSQFRLFVYLLEQCERQIKYRGGISKKESAEFYSAADRKMEIRKEGKEMKGKPVTLLCVILNEIAVQKQGLMVSFSKDYLLFKKLVKSGQLYEHIQKLIWKETGRSISRSEAKKVMFTIAFASYRYQPEEKQIMRKYFPSVVGVIDGYKRKCVNGLIGESANERKELANERISEFVNGEQVHPLAPSKGGKETGISQRDTKRNSQRVTEARKEGNASFAILLQQVESLIFIDEILAKCHKKGIKALSKHDSIVCRQCDKHKVTAVVCKVLNSLFGRYTYALDIDGDLFELKPKRKTRLGRVAATLFSQMKVGMNWGNGPPGGQFVNVRNCEFANGGQEVGRPLVEWKNRDSILVNEKVGPGDTAAGIYQKLGSKFDSDAAVREKHRRDLELFKLKLEERRKRSFRR